MWKMIWDDFKEEVGWIIDGWQIWLTLALLPWVGLLLVALLNAVF